MNAMTQKYGIGGIEDTSFAILRDLPEQPSNLFSKRQTSSDDEVESVL